MPSKESGLNAKVREIGLSAFAGGAAGSVIMMLATAYIAWIVSTHFPDIPLIASILIGTYFVLTWGLGIGAVVGGIVGAGFGLIRSKIPTRRQLSKVLIYEAAVWVTVSLALGILESLSILPHSTTSSLERVELLVLWREVSPWILPLTILALISWGVLFTYIRTKDTMIIRGLRWLAEPQVKSKR